MSIYRYLYIYDEPFRPVLNKDRWNIFIINYYELEYDDRNVCTILYSYDTNVFCCTFVITDNFANIYILFPNRFHSRNLNKIYLKNLVIITAEIKTQVV